MGQDFPKPFRNLGQLMFKPIFQIMQQNWMLKILSFKFCTNIKFSQFKN